MISIKPLTFLSQRLMFVRAPMFALSLVVSACAGDDAANIPNPNCDSLLTPADFQTVCGMELTLEPTGFEGIELNPCNRTAANNEGLLLVTRHPDPATATRAEGVAGGRGPTHQMGLGLHASAGARSVFLVEVKASDESTAICSPDKLPALLDLALSRVVTE